MNENQRNSKGERLEATKIAFLEALENYKKESDSKERTIFTIQKQIDILKQEFEQLEIKNASLIHGPFNPESITTIDEYNMHVL